jgi:hypothetical protein
VLASPFLYAPCSRKQASQGSAVCHEGAAAGTWWSAADLELVQQSLRFLEGHADQLLLSCSLCCCRGSAGCWC